MLRLLGPELAARFGRLDCGASIFGKRARLRRTMRVLGVSPARSIYIGDTSADGDAARDAGCAFGAVAWGYGANSSNPHLASRGKLGVLVACGAAVICGASVTLVNFFWGVGQSV